MKISIGRKHIPLLATATVLIVLFVVLSIQNPRFCSLRNIRNLFYSNAVLGIMAVGMTFVILSGGIDLSVGSSIAFSSMFVASMIEHHGWSPPITWLATLAIGTGFGSLMGLLIQFYKLPPFLTTLGGLFFARGMAYVVYPKPVEINNAFCKKVADLGIPLTSAYDLPLPALVFIAMFCIALYIAHYTRWGRNVYAIGGNEQSALLMGLPVARTKVLVYTFSGFCSALAGIVSTIRMTSGNPLRGETQELEAIAAVVVGGTLLTGGVGYVAGTMMGVLILGVIRAGLDFYGKQTEWLARITVGTLLLIFILLQKVLAKGAGERKS